MLRNILQYFEDILIDVDKRQKAMIQYIGNYERDCEMTKKISIMIKKLSLEFDKLAIPFFEEYGLTPSQYKVIKYLFVNENNVVRQIDIERYFSMTNPTVTGILQNLEKKDFIERKQNPDDCRSKIICLTKKTINKKEELYAAGEQLEDKLTNRLNKQEKEQISSLLSKMLGIE